MSEQTTPAVPAHASPIAHDDRTLPIIVYALLIAGLVTGGLATLIGFVIALASRSAAAPAVETHYRFQVRTCLAGLALFLVAVAVCIVGLPLMLIGIGFLLFKLGAGIAALAGIYVLVRAVAGLVRLTSGEPYPNPDSWTL